MYDYKLIKNLKKDILILVLPKKYDINKYLNNNINYKEINIYFKNNDIYNLKINKSLFIILSQYTKLFLINEEEYKNKLENNQINNINFKNIEIDLY